MEKAKGKISEHLGRPKNHKSEIVHGKLEQDHGEAKKTIGKAKSKIKNIPARGKLSTHFFKTILRLSFCVFFFHCMILKDP
jgi:uncharacterized protein YjbJ (UPF0337 family)